MKLDKHPEGMLGRLSPSDALWQIRREVRPGVMRAQRRWRRRAAYRRWGHHVETGLLWTLGVVGVVFIGMTAWNLLALLGVLGDAPW